ncbi:MAG: hypothetical protein ACT4OU_07290 [Hyphomicrobium sp.]
MSAVAAPRAPLAAYMLTDHLDAALAAGEDLVAHGQDWRAAAEAKGDDATALALAQRRVAEDVRSCELMLIARVLRAREHARALGEQDKRFGAVAELFASGTAVLLDAVAECDDARDDDFDNGDGIVAYVRSRGLIGENAPRVLSPDELAIDDNFLVAKRIALGPLLDMAAAFLDALEMHYDVYADEDEEEEAVAVRPKRRAPTLVRRSGRERDRRERAGLN